MSFGGLQQGVAAALGTVSLANAFASSQQPQQGITTTAVNLLIVVNGIAQGLIQSMRVNENFNVRPVVAIGSPVRVANIPGIYESTATIDRAFVFGQTMESAFGGNLRAVIGKQQAQVDFTKLYFNIVEVAADGSPLGTRHDCILNSVSRTYDIGGVIIMENSDITIRWANV